MKVICLLVLSIILLLLLLNQNDFNVFAVSIVDRISSTEDSNPAITLKLSKIEYRIDKFSNKNFGQITNVRSEGIVTLTHSEEFDPNKLIENILKFPPTSSVKIYGETPCIEFDMPKGCTMTREAYLREGIKVLESVPPSEYALAESAKNMILDNMKSLLSTMEQYP